MNRLHDNTLRGFRWTTLSMAGGLLLQLTQLLILVRLLSPEDFGLMALALVVIRFAGPVVEAGLSQAIIQQQQIQKKQLSTLYWINIANGLLMFILLLFISQPLAAFYDEPQLREIIILVSISFILTPPGSQFQALLTKSLEFDKLAKIYLLSLFFDLLISVSLAVIGYGVYALVYGYLARALVNSLGNIWFGRRHHRPSFEFSVHEVKTMLRFGIFEAGNLMLSYIGSNIDKLIIGKLLGTYWLGLYSVAFDLISLPVGKINPVFTKVLFPVLSRIQNVPAQFDNWYRKAVEWIVLINFPLFAMLIVVAPLFVAVFYGSDWADMTQCLQILAIAGMGYAFGNPGSVIFLAKGRTDIGFYWNIFRLVSMTIIVYFFVVSGQSIESAAWAQVTGATALASFGHILIARTGNINYARLLKYLLLILVLCLLLIGIVYLAGWLLGGGDIVVFILQVFTGICVFALVLYTFDRKRFFNLLRLNFEIGTSSK